MHPFDGFQLARHIHDQPEYAGICVVALSALSDKEIARRGGLPADVLLYRKPLTADRLLGFLEAHAQSLRKAAGAGADRPALQPSSKRYLPEARPQPAKIIPDPALALSRGCSFP